LSCSCSIYVIFTQQRLEERSNEAGLILLLAFVSGSGEGRDIMVVAAASLKTRSMNNARIQRRPRPLWLRASSHSRSRSAGGTGGSFISAISSDDLLDSGLIKPTREESVEERLCSFRRADSKYR